jgi:nucleotide-binding universal stress UspA family protein
MSRDSAPFRSILVPIDGSELSEQAFPLALAIAKRARAKVKVVLVHRHFHPSVLQESSPEFTQTELFMHQYERNYLKDLVTKLRERWGVAISSAVLEGPIVRTLAGYIRDMGADLVVMTTHGQGGVRRAWLGSTADQLVRSADIPVLLVRATEEIAAERQANFGEILVPLDGSPLAEASLEPAAALASLWDGEVSLVQVVPPVVLASDHMVSFAGGLDERLTELGREAAKDYLQDVAERLRAKGVKASGVAVLGGSVAETLLEIADPKRVGLVVISTHGRGGVRRFILGSVADKLVRAADVPVLVVRAAGRRAKKGAGKNVSVGASA